MINTFTQIHIQCIFAVKHRDAMIEASWSEKLNKYITGIVQNKGHRVIAVNNMPDHVHLFFGMRPHQSLSDLMRIVKGDSSEWINRNGFCKTKFNWQEGYGAFSYDRSMVNAVADYVENQQLHHSKKPFLEEYRDLLEEFKIEYQPHFIFKEPV